MPGVKVVVDPSVAKDVTTLTEDFLEEVIPSLVAKHFKLKDGVSGVEVRWVYPRRAKNAAPIGIEVWYSESENLHPNRKTRNALKKSLMNLVNEYPGKLPLSVSAISAWILPQQGAVFGYRQQA